MELEDVWRREVPHVLAALLRRGDRFDDCEDAAQEALLDAADQWPHEGVPRNPRGWLVRVASRRLIDAHRANTARTRREVQDEIAKPVPPVTWQERTGDHDDSLQMLVPSRTTSTPRPTTPGECAWTGSTARAAWTDGSPPSHTLHVSSRAP